MKDQSLAMPIAIVVGAALVAAAVYFSGMAHPTTPRAQNPQPTATADVSKVKTDGEPFIGSVTAPVTIAYWFDYQCPFCKQNELESIAQLKKDYVDTGKVRIVFKDFAFLGPDSQTLAQWARAVWAYAPDKYYDWHHAIFADQGTENTGWATAAEIAKVTTSVLGQAGEAAVAQLVKQNGANYQRAIDADKAEGASMGITGTPGMIVGKQLVVGAVPYAQVKSAIDAQLKK